MTRPADDRRHHSALDKAAWLDDAALPIGTTLLTLDGTLPVEYLVPGDRVITRDGAYRLRAALRHTVPQGLRMVRVSRDALGGKPDADITLLPRQRVLIRDWRARALYDAPQACVPVERLIDREYVRWTMDTPAHVISLHFDRQVILYAAGLELQSTARLAPPVSDAA
ncbi:Hint domain-containing protein [Boseongicola sp. H5]|uniref:Hint domain-containing protein n=1 Tax=Boseongicola sp. H5 TaxID=2763261 RepID=UPI001D0BBBB6|nr:Hint domain-containing protein [Boseongicola sp. H5]